MDNTKPEYLGDFGGAPDAHETTSIGQAAEEQRTEKTDEPASSPKAKKSAPEAK